MTLVAGFVGLLIVFAVLCISTAIEKLAKATERQADALWALHGLEREKADRERRLGRAA